MITRIIPIIIVLIAGGIFFTYINPTYTEKIAAVQAQIKVNDGALEAAKVFKNKESQLSGEQDAIPQEGKDRIAAFLPDSVDNVQLILDLNSLADRSGIKLSGFNVVKNEANPSDTPSLGTLNRASSNLTDSLDVSVTGVGSYSAFRTFLANVEGSLRPLDLLTLSITQGDGGKYSYQMKFRIYWLR